MTNLPADATNDPFEAARNFAAHLRAAAFETDGVTDAVMTHYWAATRADTFADLDRLDALIRALPALPLPTDGEDWRETLWCVVDFYRETFSWTEGRLVRVEAVTDVPGSLAARIEYWIAETQADLRPAPNRPSVRQEANQFAEELLSDLTGDLYGPPGEARTHLTATFEETLSTLHDLLALTTLLNPYAELDLTAGAIVRGAMLTYAQLPADSLERVNVRRRLADQMLRDLRPWLDERTTLSAAFLDGVRDQLSDHADVVLSAPQLEALVRSDLRLTRDAAHGVTPDSETRERALHVLARTLTGETWPDHAVSNDQRAAFQQRLRQAAQRSGYVVTG